MKKALIWGPLLAALLTMGTLYAIGIMLDIELLQAYYHKLDPSEGLFEAGGSFIPILIGIIVGFITEKVLKMKQTKRTKIV